VGRPIWPGISGPARLKVQLLGPQVTLALPLATTGIRGTWTTCRSPSADGLGRHEQHQEHRHRSRGDSSGGGARRRVQRRTARFTGGVVRVPGIRDRSLPGRTAGRQLPGGTCAGEFSGATPGRQSRAGRADGALDISDGRCLRHRQLPQHVPKRQPGDGHRRVSSRAIVSRRRSTPRRARRGNCRCPGEPRCPRQRYWRWTRPPCS